MAAENADHRRGFLHRVPRTPPSTARASGKYIGEQRIDAQGGVACVALDKEISLETIIIIDGG